MSMLPAGFEDLEPFAPTWALWTEQERLRQVSEATMDELETFYSTALPYVDKIACFLNGEGHPHDWDDEARNLLSIAISVFEAHPPLRVYGTIGGSRLACEHDRVEVTSPALWELPLKRYHGDRAADTQEA